MVASEMTPFAKTGGLGDVVGALPKALAGLGHHVSVMIPYYRCVETAVGGRARALCYGELGIRGNPTRFDLMDLGKQEKVHLYGIRKGEYFDRSQLYGLSSGEYDDNAERFVFFSRAAVQSLQILGLKTDVVHAHDWQTALVPLLLREKELEGVLQGIRTVFTIHNLAYQGVFHASEFSLTGLSSDHFTPEGLEYYGKLNLMKAGIIHSDAVTTVSPRYSQEIQTRDFGCGLEGVLQSRRRFLHGILNGIDQQTWSPEKDKNLVTAFSASKLAGKRKCRDFLLKAMKLKSAPGTPVFGLVTRLTGQKGIDLLLPLIPEIIRRGGCFAVLASGDAAYERAFEKFTREYPLQFGLKIGFDEALAHRIYAGSDFLLMPSIYEPCGLSQLYALRYGTIPIVRATGGLDDTVEDWSPRTQKGNGLKFIAPSVEALRNCVNDAFQLIQDAAAMTRLQKNGMKADFSWGKSARTYEKLYLTLQSHA